MNNYVNEESCEAEAIPAKNSAVKLECGRHRRCWPWCCVVVWVCVRLWSPSSPATLLAPLIAGHTIYYEIMKDFRDNLRSGS
jgi:hypothetical protein